MKVTRVETAAIRLQIVKPPPDLAPYITALYRTDALTTAPIEDWLPPEWANLRIGQGSVYQAAIGDAPLRQVPACVLSGPTSRVTRLRIANGQFWGVGLLPLGWACLIGSSASDHADTFHDAHSIAAVDPLRAIIDHLAHDAGDFERDLRIITAELRALLGRSWSSHVAIVKAHEAILSDRFTSVGAMASHLGMETRTLERFTRRHFGFTPKLLMRRQRFLRSLANFMVDPTMTWLESLDSHYHDQAQFVREFKHFMLMRPNEYAAMDHPIAGAAVRARRMALGDPMQVLHRPPSALAAELLNSSDNRDRYETL